MTESENSVILSIVHHHENPLESTSKIYFEKHKSTNKLFFYHRSIIRRRIWKGFMQKRSSLGSVGLFEFHKTWETYWLRPINFVLRQNNSGPLDQSIVTDRRSQKTQVWSVHKKPRDIETNFSHCCVYGRDRKLQCQVLQIYKRETSFGGDQKVNHTIQPLHNGLRWSVVLYVCMYEGWVLGASKPELWASRLRSFRIWRHVI
jgi:hypothetical protein